MRITYLSQLMLLLYASQFVIAPIVIYFTNKQSANPQFTTFDLENPPLQLPPSYMQSLPLLESLGFQPVAHLFSGGLATNLRAATGGRLLRSRWIARVWRTELGFLDGAWGRFVSAIQPLYETPPTQRT